MRLNLSLLLVLIWVPMSTALGAERPWLDRALQVAEWLDGLEGQGGAVPVDALTPDAFRDDLASGTAGQILFRIALYESTGDNRQLDAVRRRADRLVREIPTELQLDAFPPATSFYYGLSGVSFALHRAWRVTGDEGYRDAAERSLRLILDSARTDGNGLRYWSQTYDELLFGNTGTALFLIYAAIEMDDESALDVAVEQGRRLIRLSDERAARTGEAWNWSMRRDRPELIVPNFTHGASGIGYFFATLAMATGDREFRAAALGAAQTMENMAVRDWGGVLFPYGFGQDQWEGRYDLGWAHGVAGTARLFQRLSQMTADSHWNDLTEECALTIARSNAPGTPAMGFGEDAFPIDRRFGLAGAAEFLVARYRQTNESTHLDRAMEIADYIFEQAKRDTPGLSWESARPAFAERPGEPARFTGWLTGAIGYGLLFLDIDAAQRGVTSLVRLPDDPLAFVPAP